MMANTLAWGMPGTTELIVIAIIALLVFGRRLPDVARSVGKSIVEFKKGIRDVKDDIDVHARIDASTTSSPSGRLEQKSDQAKVPPAATESAATEESKPPSATPN